jgi:hypothetical protein
VITEKKIEKIENVELIVEISQAHTVVTEYIMNEKLVSHALLIYEISV